MAGRRAATTGRNPGERGWSNFRAGLIFFALMAAATVAIHYPLLRMPFYWDELGQFVPAALDIFERGAWVPVTTLPNIHPPMVMAYLAGVWKLFGYSISVTRLAMLLLASTGVFLAFRLTLRLAAGTPGLPGFTTVLLLFTSPLFYTQAMMAQLDMPAMVLTLLALSLFLEERIVLAVAACAGLVWVKETGAVLPAVLGIFLWREGRRREALWFLIPLVSLVPWIWLLWRKTGSVFGNLGFAEYNLWYPLHPARLALALSRRFWELCLNHGYFLGAAPLAILWRRAAVFARREWRLMLWFTMAHVIAVTLAGGAVLERYLLPVLPLSLAGFAIAWNLLGGRKAVLLPLATAAISAAGFFLPPILPQPEENDLQMLRSVSLYEAVADWMERSHPGAAIATSWPLSDALARPGLGYVENRCRVYRMAGFTEAEVRLVAARKPDVFLLYSDDEFERSWIHQLFPSMDLIRRHLYQWEPPVPGRDAEWILGMREEVRWQSDGASLSVFVRPRSLK